MCVLEEKMERNIKEHVVSINVYYRQLTDLAL
jgi:hypothetical protein